MKKVIVLFLVVVMAVSTLLSGCGTKVENSDAPTIDQAQEDVRPGNPHQGAQTQYIKNGKLNYFDVMLVRCAGADGEGCVEVLPDGLAMNALINELKELYPDMAKSTIQNIVSPMVKFDNTEQTSGLHNGDIVTIEVSVIQSKLDMWNEYFGDIELVIETTHTITVEGLE